jgi:ketosteroid isomerase-like protein
MAIEAILVDAGPPVRDHRPVSTPDAQAVQVAFDAAIGGDIEPLVALLAPDLEWRGVDRGHLWWRNAPS